MRLSRLTMPLVAVSALLAAAAAAQESGGGDPDAGQLMFNNACRTCHVLDEGDNRLGPSLYGIVGREAGSLPDYAYSSAMDEAGFVWDEVTLDRFIANPDEVVPGNGMKPYTGIASKEDRAKIIAFLKANGGK